MGNSYRRHTLIEAPVEEVWSVISNPGTHPEWWPELEDVEVSGELREGGEYTRFVRRFGFLDLVDGIWIAETLEELKEARFRCTVSGTYTQFRLTPAQRDTFVELEAGMLPTSPRWRVADGVGRLWIPRWIRELLDNLPAAVGRPRD